MDRGRAMRTIDFALRVARTLHPQTDLRLCRVAVTATAMKFPGPASEKTAAIAVFLSQKITGAFWLWQTDAPVLNAKFDASFVTGVPLAFEGVVSATAALALRHLHGDDWLATETAEADATAGEEVIAQAGVSLLIEGASRCYRYVRYWSVAQGSARAVGARFAGLGKGN